MRLSHKNKLRCKKFEHLMLSRCRYLLPNPSCKLDNKPMIYETISIEFNCPLHKSVELISDEASADGNGLYIPSSSFDPVQCRREAFLS